MLYAYREKGTNLFEIMLTEECETVKYINHINSSDGYDYYFITKVTMFV